MMRNNGDLLEEVIYEKFNDLIEVLSEKFPKITPKLVADELITAEQEIEDYMVETRSFLIGYVRGVFDGTRH